MSAQKRILIVEDEPQQAANTALRLQGMGYQVLGPVDNGDEAIRLAEAERPDLVLMDIVLHGHLDGIDAARRIGRLSLPVIYLTGHLDKEVLERAKQTEPLGFVVKPFTDREMHATITMAIYRSEMERQLAEFKAIVDQAHHDADVEQAMLLRLLNRFPGLAYHRELEAGITYLSAGAQRLTGYTLEQLKDGSVTLASLIDAQDRERVVAAQANARNGEDYQVDYRLIAADGTVRPVRETGYGVRTRDGSCTAIEAFITPR